MQLTHSRGQYVEKIMHDSQGVLVRATFFVYESHGRIKARLISVAPYSESFAPATPKALPSFSISSSILPKISGEIFSAPILSNLFSFFTSQPTRAPSFSF